MKIHLIAFSSAGCLLAEKTAELLEENGHSCICSAAKRFRGSSKTVALEMPVSEWTKEAFRSADALIFCCACGIAVRSIAPFVKSKTTDPAVVALDETGKFAVPLLSGHIGGANELAAEIAAGIGALPVVTTATDLHGLFAVDVFAKKNHLYITDMQLAKEISAALLAHRKVGIDSDLPLPENLPEGLVREPDAELGIRISNRLDSLPFSKTLTLIPQIYAVGIGCKKGKSAAEIEEFWLKTLQEKQISPFEVRTVASIDLKKEESGILSLCEKYRLPFLTYPAQRLNEVPGDFTKSDFVKRTVGVDCVCERAAVCAGSNLLYSKSAGSGITLAVGVYKEDICFE